MPLDDLSHRALCSLEDVTDTLNITLGVNDPRQQTLTRMINAASEEIYGFTNREFIAEKDYFADDTDTEVRLFDYSLYGLGRDVIEVGDMQVEPDSVDILDQNMNSVSTPVIGTDTDFFPRIRPAWAPITTIRFRNHCSLNRYSVVSVTSKWGFPQLPQDVRNGCVETVRLWWDQMVAHSASIEGELSGGGLPVRNLPSHVLVSLNKYRRIPA